MTSSYTLHARIGQGGMAEVFKASKSGPDGFTKVIAIKKILPIYADQPHFIKMLSTEAKIHSHLNHPNIVQIFDFFKDDQEYFMVLEFVEGKNLRDVLSLCRQLGFRLPWQAIVYVIAEILKALSYAHDKKVNENALNIVHRDVSPQNILISFEGEIKLTDFGIAKARVERDETDSGVIKGKYRYVSPEQILEKEITPASDLFSLGVVLYELLTLSHPFGEAKDYKTLKQIAELPHKPISMKKTGLPNQLREIADKSLQKDLKHRYQNANQFYEDLMSIQEKKWMTHGQELFRDLVHKLFPEKNIEVPMEKTIAFSKEQSMLASSPRKQFRFWIGTLGLTSLIIFICIWGYVSLNQEIKTSTSVEKTEEKIAPKEIKQLKKTTSKKPISKPKGTLRFMGPSGTRVYLNGKDIGQLPMSALVLPPKSYSVLLKTKDNQKLTMISVLKNQETLVTWE